MPSLHQIPLKKPFLYALIGSVTVSALLGIGAILIGDFGDFEVRVLLTSLTISGASLCGLSCGAALAANRGRVLPNCGIGLAVLAALMIIAGLWTEPESEVYWKTAATVAIFAATCSQMALLLLAQLAPKYRWSSWMAYVVLFGVALIISVIMWAEFDGDPIIRLLGVAAILDGAVTILIPIFHRLSRGDIETSTSLADGPSLSEIDREIAHLQSRLSQLERLREQVSSSEPAAGVLSRA